MIRISSVLSWGIGPCRETIIALMSLSLDQRSATERQCSRKRALVKTGLGRLSRRFVQRIAPVGRHRFRRSPEAEASRRSGALQHVKLVPQGWDFEVERGPRTRQWQPERTSW
jgi:hypothetical protein